MLLESLHAKRQQVARLATRYGRNQDSRVRIGCRGEDGPESDIDFLVEFPHGYDMFGQRLPLAEQLSTLFGRQVEVIPEHELSQHFRDRVSQEAREL